MIEKFDLKNKVYNEYETQHKINELVEAVNKLTQQQTKEPKWKVGDTMYYINFSDFSDESFIEECHINNNPAFLEELNSGKDPNAFKTLEQAQLALDEIIQVLRKYQ